MSQSAAPNSQLPLCLICGEPVEVGATAVIITQTSLDEEGEPDFATHSMDGVAHPGCWETSALKGE